MVDVKLSNDRWDVYLIPSENRWYAYYKGELQPENDNNKYRTWTRIPESLRDMFIQEFHSEWYTSSEWEYNYPWFTVEIRVVVGNKTYVMLDEGKLILE